MPSKRHLPMLVAMVVVLGFAFVGNFGTAAAAAETTTDSGSWLGYYYNNVSAAGDWTSARWDPAINFDWGTGSPMATINGDAFAVRWQRTVNFEPATYVFRMVVDDGATVVVGGQKIIDAWTATGLKTIEAEVYLSGSKDIEVLYFELGGNAVAKLTWWKKGTTAPTDGQGGGGTTVSGTPLSNTVIQPYVNLYVRSGPGIENGIIGAIRPGETYTAYEYKYGWYKILYNNTYGWVSGGYVLVSTGSVPGTTVPTAPDPGAQTGLVFEENGATTVFDGPPGDWFVGSGGSGGRFVYSMSSYTINTDYNWMRWFPNVSPAYYDVYVYIPAVTNQAGTVRYWVRHARGYTPVLINQAANANTWVYLGKFEFGGSTAEFVSVSDVLFDGTTTVRYVTFDAVKLVKSS